MHHKRLLVTGGAGFIGSCFVMEAVGRKMNVLNLDKLTYSGNLLNLSSLATNPLHKFVRGDIGDTELTTKLLEDFQPEAVLNFAAESHVDRSIVNPGSFVHTNVLGTCSLLQTTLAWWKKLPEERAKNFRFLHVSTDEVFGALKADAPPFTEATPYAPNSPYSASKAASDHFVRAYHETYGLPTLITNCSNNYGPRQFPEKLIPLVILRAISGEEIPVYGSGENIRDWLQVEDHCAAILSVLENGRSGQTYIIGGRAERANIQVVRAICELIDELHPDKNGPTDRLIRMVKDRAGHDFRYAVNCSKIERELGWKQRWSFEQGLRKTVIWYLNNQDWLQTVQSGEYRNWLNLNYAQR